MRPACIALLLYACSAPPQAGGAFLSVVVNAQTSSAQITRVSVTVTPAGASADLLPNADGTFSRTLEVSVGLQTVTASAWAGTVLAGTGVGSVTVEKGKTAHLSILALDVGAPPPPPDHSPVIASLAASATTVGLGDQVSLLATATDADGDAIAFAWSASPAGCGTFAASATSPSATWTAAAQGPCLVTVTASARALSDSRSVSILVGPAFPLKPSANGRYLVDRHDRPYRIQGDSAQSLIVNLSLDEAQAYLADRKAKGFNTVNVNLLEHRFGSLGKGATLSGVPVDRNGDLPFLGDSSGGPYDGTWGTADFSTPNERYFAFADSVIDLAAANGLLVHLAYLYLGIGGGAEGWWADLVNSANTQDACFRFGQYLGNRYKDRANVVWIVGGDYTPPPGSEGETRLHKILEGMQAAGAVQLQAGDWSAPTLSTDVAAFAASMDMNAVYTYGGPGFDTYTEAAKGFLYSPARPAYLKETGYEEEGWIPGDPASIRKYQYWAVLGGATAGLFYGHRDVWEFATADWWSGFGFGHRRWQDSLDTPGASDVARMGQLLDSIHWFDLVPSGLAGMRVLVVSGGGSAGSSDYVTAAATADGTALLAYLPPTGVSARTITVDMAALSGFARARWYSPATGTYTDIAGSPFPGSGQQDFTTPGDNGTGTNDWVLVLDR